jgi:hypothetical protein
MDGGSTFLPSPTPFTFLFPQSQTQAQLQAQASRSRVAKAKAQASAAASAAAVADPGAGSHRKLLTSDAWWPERFGTFYGFYANEVRAHWSCRRGTLLMS